MSTEPISAEALVERLFGSVLGMMDGLTPVELAAKTGTDARYVREWLEQQAVTGILHVDGQIDPDRRSYTLPAPYVEVFTDRDSLNYLAPFARMMVGVVRPLPAVLEAFRSGGGVAYADYDSDFNEGQGEMNRTMFINLLGSQWLPVIADVDARLRADPPARVADVACGTGFSSLAIAQAYPRVRVDGIDLDDASIDLARHNLACSGLSDRVSFGVADAADPKLLGRYDLVTVFEAVHDMSNPAGDPADRKRLLALLPAQPVTPRSDSRQ